MMLSVMAGCGSNAANSSSEDELKPAKLGDSTTNEATLVFYFNGWQGRNGQNILNQVAEKCKDELNIKLDIRFFRREEFEDNLRLAIESGESVDAIGITANYIDEFVRNDLIQDITTLFPKSAPKLYEKYTTDDLKMVTYDNRLWAIPSLLINTDRIFAVAREDLLEKYGIKEIKTYEDVEKFLTAVKAQDSSLGCFAQTDDLIAAFGITQGYVSLPGGFVYRWDDNDMKVIPFEQTDAFNYGVNLIKRWYKEQLVNDKVFYSGPTSQRVAIFIGNWYRAEDYLETLILDLKKLPYTMFPLYPENMAERKTSLTPALAIGKTSANPERTIKFFEWVQSSQENYDLFIYGVQGRDYYLNNGKLVYDRASYFARSNLQAFFNKEYHRPSLMSPSNYEDLLKVQIPSFTKAPPTWDFQFDSGVVADLMNEREALFRALYEGIQKDPFGYNIDKFIEDAKKAGADSIAAEYQKQLNQWKASKLK